MSKEIYGIIDNCYNSFYVFRGFAQPELLIQYSEPYAAYQRRPEDKHVEEIADFIQSGKNIYTPEIVLAYSISDWFDRSVNPLFAGGALPAGTIGPLDLLTRQSHDLPSGYAHIVLKDRNKISFSRSKKHSNLSLVKCSLPDTLAAKPFRRIDGNHRLDAMDTIRDKIAAYTVPFCVILLTGDSFSSIPNTAPTARIEMEIFHNINSKAKPLTPLEQYRGLFNLFTASELESYGKEFGVTKSYLEKHGDRRFTNIAAFLTDKEDIVLCCFRYLMDNGLTATEDELVDVFDKLEHTLFAQEERIRHCKSSAAIIPYVYYCFAGGKQKNAKLTAYHTWFVKNRLYDVKNIDPASMVDVFNSIYEIRKKQIFVAMPFSRELDFVFDAVREAVLKINQENHADLLEPVRIDKQIVGFSYDIVKEISESIKNAGLLIADLTYQNANVYYEVGYAQGLLQAKLGNTAEVLYLISNPKKPDEPFASAKFDVEHYKMIPYKNVGNGGNELKAALEKELKAFYGI